MDPSELAKLMLAWETRRREADDLEEQIKTAVLDIGKTQTVGNVRATFSKGRRRFDYHAAIREAGYDSPSQLEPWRQVSYNYQQACIDLHIESVPSTRSESFVSVKLLG